jgi:hypothetical protein
VKIITEKLALAELKQLAEQRFGTFVKAVVDVDKKVMAVDAELHADQEALLIEHGSRQADLWGINLYPENAGAGFIEYDSMINLKPSQGNRSRGVESAAVREQIAGIVRALIAS